MIEKVGNNWFVEAEIEKPIVPSSVRSLGKHTFYWCRQLREVVFEPGSRLECIRTECFIKSSFMDPVASGVQNIEPKLLRIAQQSGKLGSDGVVQQSRPTQPRRASVSWSSITAIAGDVR